MKIHLTAERNLLLACFDEPGLEIVPGEEHVHFAALEMFASSLALCTASVLVSYAQVLKADLSALSIRIRWDYAEGPYRVGRMRMDLDWPGLPENRHKAVLKAARRCTVHHTLTHPPEIETHIEEGSAGVGSEAGGSPA